MTTTTTTTMMNVAARAAVAVVALPLLLLAHPPPSHGGGVLYVATAAESAIAAAIPPRPLRRRGTVVILADDDGEERDVDNRDGTSRLPPPQYVDVVLSSNYPDVVTNDLYEAWRTRHGRGNAKDDDGDDREMMARRKATWLQNHARIASHNAMPGVRYTLGHNEYSDMTYDEFRERFSLGGYGGDRRRDAIGGGGGSGGAVASSYGRRRGRKARDAIVDLPPSVPGNDNGDDDEDDGGGVPIANVPTRKDWREDGAVTRVKNQASSGGAGTLPRIYFFYFVFFLFATMDDGRR
jgi:hypothetical protein